MSKRDRSVLGGLVLAMIVGVGGSLALAASCLGRDSAHRADDTTSGFPEDRSARTSSGGVPGEEAVGTTEITSVELPAGAPTPAPAPANAPPPNPNPTPIAPVTAPPAAPPPTTNAAPRPAPAPTANATVTVNVNGNGNGTQVTTTTRDGGVTESTESIDGGVIENGIDGANGGGDAGATNAGDGGATRNGGDAGATSAAAAAPAPSPRFLTEPPPFGASSWAPNHEAGAGPFTTERNVPPAQGP